MLPIHSEEFLANLWEIRLFGKERPELAFLQKERNFELYWEAEKQKTNDHTPHTYIFIWEDFSPNKFDFLFKISQKISSLLSRKIVLILGNDKPKKEHINILSELEIDHIFYGEKKEEKLISHLKNELFEAEKIASTSHYQKEIHELLTKRDKEKLKSLLKSISSLIDNSDLVKIISQAYYSIGEFSLARKILKKRLQLVPDDLWTADKLARLYWQDKDFSNALQYLERLDKVQGFNPIRTLLLGRIYFSLKRFDRALSLFQKGKVNFSFFADIFSEGIAKIYLKNGRDKEALHLLLQNTVLSRDFISFLLSESFEHYSKKDFLACQLFLQIGIEACNDDPQGRGYFFYNQALCFLNEFNIEQAINSLNKASENNSTKNNNIEVLIKTISPFSGSTKETQRSGIAKILESGSFLYVKSLLV